MVKLQQAKTLIRKRYNVAEMHSIVLELLDNDSQSVVCYIWNQTIIQCCYSSQTVQ